MMPPTSPSAEERLRDIVHIYLAVARTDSGGAEPHERQLAVQLGQAWAPECQRSRVEAIVDTAYVAVRGGLTGPCDAIARKLCRELSHEDCQRLLRDLGLIARADGHVTVDEARVIALVRGAIRGGGSQTEA